MGWQSSLPGAIDQLVLIAKQAPELADIVVRDGPQMENDAALSVLYIGWTGGTGDVDADARIIPEGMAGNPDREQSMIQCTAWVVSGSTEIGDVRRAAYAILSGLGAAIDRDRTLNRTVMRASIGDHTLTQQQTPAGAQVAVAFAVDTDAFTRR